MVTKYKYKCLCDIWRNRKNKESEVIATYQEFNLEACSDKQFEFLITELARKRFPSKLNGGDYVIINIINCNKTPIINND